MDKTLLTAQAKKLKQPSSQSAEEFAAKRDSLANQVTLSMKERPDLERLIGKDNVRMMEDNHRNQAKFLESVFYTFDPDVLVDTVLWVFRAYRSHGFQLTYWPAQLDTWVKILKKDLSPSAYSEIYPFFNWLIIHQSAFVTLSEIELKEAFIPPGHGDSSKSG